MYLTSFAHREDLFHIAERWFHGRPEPSDAMRLTEIFICDGFIIGETLRSLAKLILGAIHPKPFHEKRIRFKGELRDVISRCTRDLTPRTEELFRLYTGNPEFYYREVPINGVMCLDSTDHLLALYRIKRPKRIAEKANRKISNWLFHIVQKKAQQMAEDRARRSGLPLMMLVTPEDQMVKEFVEAEGAIAHGFSEATIKLDRAAMTIHDVAGIKIIADETRLNHLEFVLDGDPLVKIIDKQIFEGDYQAVSMILEVYWDRDHICRRYADCRSWKKYVHRGIPEDSLKKGLEPFLSGAKPTIELEIILSTFPNMVESELGNSIHEGMIIAQRNNRQYKGYIPTNVEFLLEYLFSVGFSPKTTIEDVPIKLWGRYLPDTLIAHVRRLYDLSPYDLFY